MITMIQNSSFNGFGFLSRTAFYIHPVAYFLLAMHIGVFLGALSFTSPSCAAISAGKRVRGYISAISVNAIYV